MLSYEQDWIVIWLHLSDMANWFVGRVGRRLHAVPERKQEYVGIRHTGLSIAFVRFFDSFFLVRNVDVDVECRSLDSLVFGYSCSCGVQQQIISYRLRPPFIDFLKQIQLHICHHFQQSATTNYGLIGFQKQHFLNSYLLLLINVLLIKRREKYSTIVPLAFNIFFTLLYPLALFTLIIIFFSSSIHYSKEYGVFLKNGYGFWKRYSNPSL